MRRILFSILFTALLMPAQATFGTPLEEDPELVQIITRSPIIPDIQAGANKLIQEQIASFEYDLPEKGEIVSASIQFEWSGKNINKISKLRLYLDDKLVIDFGEYYRGLDKAERKSLKESLRQNGWITFLLDFTEDDFGLLKDEEVFLILDGKPKFFNNLHLSDVTLTIVDPVNGAAVPEPSTLILMGISMAGIIGLRRCWKE